MDISFSIANFDGWLQEPLCRQQALDQSTSNYETHEISAIPAMLRRRLNSLGRITAAKYLSLLNQDECPIVYCSRHGDMERSFKILADIATNSPVSPTQFSLTVHNAIPGILSIHTVARRNISSIAAGKNGLVPTLLEATGLLSSSCHRVVCLLADVPLPDIYRQQGYGPEKAYSVVFEVTNQDGIGLSMTCLGGSGSDDSGASHLAAIEFIDFLNISERKFETVHNGSHWKLEKD